MTVEIELHGKTANYTAGNGWSSEDVWFESTLRKLEQVAEKPLYAPDQEFSAAEQIAAVLPGVRIVTSLPVYEDDTAERVY